MTTLTVLGTDHIRHFAAPPSAMAGFPKTQIYSPYLGLANTVTVKIDRYRLHVKVTELPPITVTLVNSLGLTSFATDREIQISLPDQATFKIARQKPRVRHKPGTQCRTVKLDAVLMSKPQPTTSNGLGSAVNSGGLPLFSSGGMLQLVGPMPETLGLQRIEAANSALISSNEPTGPVKEGPVKLRFTYQLTTTTHVDTRTVTVPVDGPKG